MTTDTKTIRFSELELSPDIAKAITSTGYEIPTPIQAKAIPLLLEGKDLMGIAQTGTGKTAAFALPLLSNIDITQKQPQIICLTPTRELAIQVAEAFQTYAQFMKNFKVLPIYGGTEYRGQIRQLERGVHVVVGTPGRVMDHMRKGTLKLDQIKALVLDEADEMLRMGFIDDVEWILQHIPDKHQSAFFSATMPASIKKLAQKYLNKPIEITIEQKTTTAEGIRQRYVQLKNNEKLDMLTRIMDVEEFDAAIVFVRTKNSTIEVSDRLQARGYAVSALNGDIAQNQRERIITNLKNGKLDIIVATDVAARGLDVERISHVFNYDVPYDTESYVHRIGRTGRAGRQGDAILFVNGRERRMLQSIEKATRNKIEAFQFPSVASLNEKKIEQFFSRINLELEKDLTEYQSVIKKYLAEFEVPVEKLAAALASIEADSQPFYMSQHKVRPSEGRFEEQDLREGKRKNNAHKFSESVSMRTFRIEVGKQHNVEKKDIVGAIANEAGIESRYMGKIFMAESHSTIELPEGMPDDVFNELKNVTVRGQKLNIKEAGDEDRITEDSGRGNRDRFRSERGRSDRGERSGRPERNRSDRSGKPERNRSDRSRSDHAKPDRAKSERARPDRKRSEDTQGDAGKDSLSRDRKPREKQPSADRKKSAASKPGEKVKSKKKHDKKDKNKGKRKSNSKKGNATFDKS